MNSPEDVAAWRAVRRRELLALREGVPEDERRVADQRIGELLAAGFPLLAGVKLGFYWPYRGEVDPRAAVLRLRTLGARTVLPVVIAKGRPLEFREWRADTITTPGVLGLPIPQGSAVLAPDAVLMPPVGFDTRGYRLGYGGGFFDRTLAAAAPRPLAIGLAHAASRIDTIYPQPWDVPMDFVITEEGIECNEAGGLRRLARAEDAAAIAAERLARRT